MFRYTKAGTLVGKRTWGGLIGVLGFPTLMDGGTITAPNIRISSLCLANCSNHAAIGV